ncbi:anthocyanidin 5,3-O-glucosyltransferase-like [Phragmites australis]|uniref:anthocyanidin 5,3-O-glucosyltransferase-like n=1 Tax=Phragmites australis TaxID=29695 RepID=UPI002D767257|nr:anthocyanidin 5,3-O-glucosyltransferase-like [Phragmites australis]XP_062231951.1 anthocyanidin 5,3-O-glucosyltransferase-like [Phragmites australis]
MEPNPNPTVVLHACLGVGHLIPMVELAKLFLRRGLAVVIAVPTPPASTADYFASSASAVADLAAANPSVSFHHLPPPDYPAPDPDPFLQMLDALRLTVPSLADFLRSLPSVAALVLDLFCVDALDAAAAAGVPAYFYYTSCAGDLAVFLHLPHYFATAQDGSASFKDMGKALLHFPGVPPIPASDMPHTVLDRADRTCAARVGHYGRIPEGRGVLINTYEWLEARAVSSLRDGVCVPGRPTPPVYPIGPLIVKGQEAAEGERHACLSWLDAQPERSVVFLCFGSLGAVSAAQLKEIARGLESSAHRFIWVVRSPPEDPSKFFLLRPEPDLDSLLPEGFLERTRDRGLVVKMWAPQVEVLRHAATGAFVTHCGWNSVLESASAGVPMLCWPLYAEQRLNKVFVVDEMKAGVVMEGYDEELVKAEEVEKKVRLVMESEDGEKLRERLALAKQRAAEALANGGPSAMAFEEFLKDLKLPKGSSTEAEQLSIMVDDGR